MPELHNADETSRPGLKALLENYERRLIESALSAHHGNQRRAAQALGLLPTTLHEKLKRLGLRPRRQAGEDVPAS
jgi:DNA-binding NtrC family response regulator